MVPATITDGLAFQLMGFEASLLDETLDANFPALFSDDYMWCPEPIDSSVNGNDLSKFARGVLPEALAVGVSSDEGFVRTASPPSTFWPRQIHRGAEERAGAASPFNNWGSIQFDIGVFDATAAAATSVHMRARWLAFPETAYRASGYARSLQYWSTGSAAYQA